MKRIDEGHGDGHDEDHGDEHEDEHHEMELDIFVILIEYSFSASLEENK
ncbi:MAG: hypothetical protein CM15mP22_6060 [Gammaproteobacteria bacterium]|nr:MAG: hypothetical protein CM15mP22_6060 [Gammaproteobacteria bacterium]